MSLSFLNKDNYIQCFVSQIGIKRDKTVDDKLMKRACIKKMSEIRPISPIYFKIKSSVHENKKNCKND